MAENIDSTRRVVIKKDNFLNGKLEVVATRRRAWDDLIDIHMRCFDDTTRPVELYTVSEIIMERAKPGELTQPVSYLYPEDAQSLMDSLWDCGLRPSQGKGSAGAMDATQKHLNDMRKIAFTSLEIE